MYRIVWHILGAERGGSNGLAGLVMISLDGEGLNGDVEDGLWRWEW